MLRMSSGDPAAELGRDNVRMLTPLPIGQRKPIDPGYKKSRPQRFREGGFLIVLGEESRR